MYVRMNRTTSLTFRAKKSLMMAGITKASFTLVHHIIAPPIPDRRAFLREFDPDVNTWIAGG
jgi:hypothetical protein